MNVYFKQKLIKVVFRFSPTFSLVLALWIRLIRRHDQSINYPFICVPVYQIDSLFGQYSYERRKVPVIAASHREREGHLRGHR